MHKGLGFAVLFAAAATAWACAGEPDSTTSADGAPNPPTDGGSPTADGGTLPDGGPAEPDGATDPDGTAEPDGGEDAIAPTDGALSDTSDPADPDSGAPTDGGTPTDGGPGPDSGLSDADLDAIWADSAFDALTDAPSDGGGDSGADVADGGGPTPSRQAPVTIHRLNRAEYNNTVRDLLGTTRTPADDFPDDDHGYGFDNNSDVLTTTPTHVELYLSAAEQLMADVFYQPMLVPDTYTVLASIAGGTTGRDDGENGWLLWSNGNVTANTTLARGGRYQLTVYASGRPAAGVAARMMISIDEAPVRTVDVTAGVGALGAYTVEVDLTAGLHVVSAAFTNDFYAPETGEDRNLWVHSWTLNGPIGIAEEPNPLRERWLTCDLEASDAVACATGILERFATQAWRRPLDDDGRDRLVGLLNARLEAGDSAEDALRTAMTAALVSPRFVFRAEGDLTGYSGSERPLDDWEMASRLSYFLWSSMPDETLFALAEAGQLQNPEVLDAQVRRMLADPRAEALVQNFAGQWLYIRAVENAQPDLDAFPEFDEALRDAMVGEMHAFFRSFIRSERPLRELLASDDVWVNARLATFYGLTGSFGETFAQVTDPSGRRGGLLSQAGLLMALSYPHRTSPVRRGKWVLGNLLCREPEPPPPGVEGLPETEESASMSLRERMELHRSDPVCATCHESMDPIGLGLEHFDAIGAWRDSDASGAIDASGELPDGLAFSGHEELALILADDPAFSRCVTRQLYTYALGRGTSTADGLTLRDIRLDYEAAGGSLADLASAIARSPAFRTRLVDGATP